MTSRMEEEKTGPSAKKTRSLPGAIYGPVVFGVLVMIGLFIWPGQLPLPEGSQATASATPATMADISSTNTATPTATGTSLPEPATPTAIPTSARTATATFVPPTATATFVPPTATATASATALPTTTPVSDSSTAEALPTNLSETAAPTATPIPWPTSNPTLLRKPPAEVDTSRTHLWFSRPVVGNNIPSAAYRFGMTFNQRLVPHRAVDIANDGGTSVVAIGPGTVFYAGEDQEQVFGPEPAFYGRVVVIEMDQRWEGHTIYALYGHLESVAVATGQSVVQGDVIGAVGSSGVAIASHLHLEVRQDDPYSYDSVRNPELWYWPFGGRGVLAGRVIDESGYFLPGTRINVDCGDGAPRYVETYWDQYTPPDDVLVENFAISDLPADTCRVWSDPFGEVIEEFVEIHPGELSMVVLQARP